MNCIDAIEGTAKSTLTCIHETAIEYRLDDTEYIRNVKNVIDGVFKFIQDNPEVTTSPETVKQVLYDFSKDLWLSSIDDPQIKATDSGSMGNSSGSEEYHDYYFDYIYTHGIYPQ